MTVFKAPQYSKVINPKTGTNDPCYTFNIECNTCDCLSFIAENDADISLQSLQKCILDNIPWWNTFIQNFLQSSTKYFTKHYTIETINKITKHTLNGTKSAIYPINIILVPTNIQICSGIFTVNWGYNAEPMIDIPDAEEDMENKINTIELNNLPVSNKIINGLEEMNMDELPDDSTGDSLELDSPTKFYEKQRVKEIRLKAKLAIYKAQRTMAQYYKKYGNDISDTDSDTSDDEDFDEDSDENSKEDVQL